MILCPICRYRDRTCKVRFLNGQQFFSCKTCFEREEKRQRSRPSAGQDPLETLGYRPRETVTRE